MLKAPFSEMRLSSNDKVATPFESVSMFPKSPTCLFWRESPGDPCVTSNGLKWGPADKQPLLRSPAALSASRVSPMQQCRDSQWKTYWIWKPCSDDACRFLTSPEMATGAVGYGCVNVTVPLTVSPLKTAIAYLGIGQRGKFGFNWKVNH